MYGTVRFSPCFGVIHPAVTFRQVEKDTAAALGGCGVGNDRKTCRGEKNK